MARMMSVDVYAPIGLHNEVQSYADEYGLSVSAAWRELARRGLQSKVVEESA